MRKMTQRLAQSDDGFAMLLALLLILVIMGISVAVAGAVVNQVHPTQYAKKDIRTGDAAQAGLQAALGQLRNTQTGGQGDLTKLPCTDPLDTNGGVTLVVGSPAVLEQVAGDQIRGQVTTTDGTNPATYRAVIAYYRSDPTPHENDAAWFTNSTNLIACRAGLADAVPAYAFVQSFGADSQPSDVALTSGNRTVHGVYQFSTTDSNTVGGRIVEFGSTNPALCMDAGTAPAAGSALTVQQCLAQGTPQQTWQYRNDLSIFYGGDTTLNLCVENVSGTPELEPCVGTGTGATYPFASSDQQNQEWSFNDNGHLAVPSSSGDVGSSCLIGSGVSNGQQSPTGAPVVIGSCSGGTNDPTAWNPDPATGAGKASPVDPEGVPAAPTNQLVNYAELGRCLDVTGQSVTADHLIDYPCKQAPDSCLLTWNQVWNYTPVSGGYGTLSTKYASGRKACDTSGYTNYCVTAPASGAAHNWVTVTPCGGTPTASQLWDATGDVPGSYANAYLLINQSDGLCMAADPSQQPTNLSSTIVVTACDGSGVPSLSAAKNYLLLKWNAPAYAPAPGLANIQEDGGSSLTNAG